MGGAAVDGHLPFRFSSVRAVMAAQALGREPDRVLPERSRLVRLGSVMDQVGGSGPEADTPLRESEVTPEASEQPMPCMERGVRRGRSTAAAVR